MHRLGFAFVLRVLPKKEQHIGRRGGFWIFRGDFTGEPLVSITLIYKDIDMSGLELAKADYVSFIVKPTQFRHFWTSAAVCSAESDTNMP